MFKHLKQMRCITPRYYKTTLSFISVLNNAAAKLYVTSFVNAAYKKTFKKYHGVLRSAEIF